MTQEGSPCIYWANAMFSEADRDFNLKCVKILRERGYQVFLPQEISVNKVLSPLAKDIFRVDTYAIIKSNLMVVCIDQETIDCGVAAEIGIAFDYGIPVIGLYTDIRQYRKGENRMYKNPYVVGAIEANGEIVISIDELLEILQGYLLHSANHSNKCTQDLSPQRFDYVPSEYIKFIENLESWYEPSWSVKTPIKQWLSFIEPSRILDFGCGPGDVSTYVLQVQPNALYVGYDQSSSMIQYAITSNQRKINCTFTSSWADVKEYAGKEAFDLALLSFVLHDLVDPLSVLKMVDECLRPGGVIVITDLSTLDLPKLTELLRNKLVRPYRTKDKRLDPVKLTNFAKAVNLPIVDCTLALPLVHFPSLSAIDKYFEMFGIYAGMDLPLALSNVDHTNTRQLVRQVLKEQIYPFTDQRTFITCALKKEN